jgi:multidrug resistance efflux pump
MPLPSCSYHHATAYLTSAHPNETPYTTPTVPTQTRSGARRLLLINGAGLLAVILLGLGIYYLWHQGYYFYSTDDATVSGPTVTVAPPVASTISVVSRRVGDTVRKGDLIATLRTPAGAVVRATSPINGTIVSEGAAPGEVLAPGTPLAQVVDLNSVSVTAYVEENHIKDVAPGEGADVTVDTVSDPTFHGSVTRILPVAASALSPIPTGDYANGNFTKTTQRIPVVITLDGSQGHTLYPGTSAEVTIHIHE